MCLANSYKGSLNRFNETSLLLYQKKMFGMFSFSNTQHLARKLGNRECNAIYSNRQAVN